MTSTWMSSSFSECPYCSIFMDDFRKGRKTFDDRMGPLRRPVRNSSCVSLGYMSFLCLRITAKSPEKTVENGLHHRCQAMWQILSEADPQRVRTSPKHHRTGSAAPRAPLRSETTMGCLTRRQVRTPDGRVGPRSLHSQKKWERDGMGT